MIRAIRFEGYTGQRAEGDPQSITVLRYGIAPSTGARARSCSVARAMESFRKQLELLDRWGFTTITLSDYRLFLAGELHLPRRPVIMTFDGLEEFLPFFPALRDVGGRAVVLVATDNLERPDRESAVSRLRSMAEAGVEIGSLTMTQRPLTALPPWDRTEELMRSRELLEEIIDGPVESCAYPGDALNREVKLAVHEAGYASALAGSSGPRLFGSDPLEIRRQEVGPDAGPLLLALRAFAPADRLARFRTRSMAFLTGAQPAAEPYA